MIEAKQPEATAVVDKKQAVISKAEVASTKSSGQRQYFQGFGSAFAFACDLYLCKCLKSRLSFDKFTRRSP